MWLCLACNTSAGACKVVDVFNEHAVNTPQDLLQLPVVQECGVVAFSANSIHTELKHKRVSLRVQSVPSSKWSDKPDCDGMDIPLKTNCVLTKYALMSHWVELQLRKPGKLLSVRKANKIIERLIDLKNVSPRYVQWVRLVFRDPVPHTVDTLHVLTYIFRRQQPQEQWTARGVIQVIEDMAAKHKRARIMFSYACAWVRKKLPESYLLACLPDYNSVWNFLAVFLNYGM